MTLERIARSIGLLAEMQAFRRAASAAQMQMVPTARLAAPAQTVAAVEPGFHFAQHPSSQNILVGQFLGIHLQRAFLT